MLAYGVGALALWTLSWKGAADSAAVYVGIPALVSLILALTPRAKTREGAVMKGVAISLGLVSTTLGPGVLCIVISLPLFIFVAIIVAMTVAAIYDRQERRRSRASLAATVVAIAVTLSSLEGLHPGLSFGVRDGVVAQHIVALSADDFRRRLARAPRSWAPLPLPLNLGFPAPVRSAGAGLEPGTLRSVFLEDRNIYLTLLGRSGRQDGNVVFRVAESGPGFVRFVPVSDASHVAKWLRWSDSVVRWREIAPGRTEVTWTVAYDRRLHPGWYFGPLIRYAARAAAGLMIDTVAAQDG